jgi:hypothetical protein
MDPSLSILVTWDFPLHPKLTPHGQVFRQTFFQFSLLGISSFTIDGIATTGEKEGGKSKKYEFKEKKEKIMYF